MHGLAFLLKYTLHHYTHVIWLFLVTAHGPEVDEIVNNDKLNWFLTLLYYSVRVLMNISSIEMAPVFCGDYIVGLFRNI